MRSPKSPLGWLLAKEWRELWSARAWWLMLLAAGPLVGLSFINSVQQYAELSGLNGTADGVGEAFSPLVGVWAPTFSSFELVAAFLFPFVVIRVVGGDRQSGALKIELQQPLSPFARVGAKAAVLGAGWLIADCLGSLFCRALSRAGRWSLNEGYRFRLARAKQVLTSFLRHLAEARHTRTHHDEHGIARDGKSLMRIAAVLVYKVGIVAILGNAVVNQPTNDHRLARTNA